MTKTAQIRKRAADKYFALELEEAARHGESLLNEHAHNQTTQTRAYADDLYNLARVYDELGDLERAMTLYTDSAHLYTDLADGDPTGYSRCLNNLAAVLFEMGHEESSAHLFWQLAAVQKHHGNDTNESFADGLYNLANAATDKNYKKYALEWHADALKMRRQFGNINDIIDSLQSIAFMHEENEEYEKAVPLAETVMELAEGDDYICAVFYLAQLNHLCGHNEAALRLYIEALEEVRKRVGRYHASYTKTAICYAELLNHMGRIHEALALQKEIRMLMEGTSGGIYTDEYALCLRETGELHKQLGQYDQAEAVFLRSLRLARFQKTNLTEDIVHLVRLYLQRGDQDRALEMLVYALMNGVERDPELSKLLTHLTIAFDPASDPTPEAIAEAITALNDRKKLAPILKKWRLWEETFPIPSYVVPPQAGLGTM